VWCRARLFPVEKGALELAAGDVVENPATRERSIVIEAPADNPERRLVSELHLRPGAAVVGEHLHPALHESFQVLEGRLGYKCGDQAGEAGPGDVLDIPAGTWHDWWHLGDGPTVCRVEVSPGDRFVEMIRTIFGLACDGLTNSRGMPSPLQMVAIAREFDDVFVLRKPPRSLQRLVFGALGPLASARGYRGIYPRYQGTRSTSTPDDIREGRSIEMSFGEGPGPPGLR
jgi:quercetin dioxygenase-like cupin family protein